MEPRPVVLGPGRAIGEIHHALVPTAVRFSYGRQIDRSLAQPSDTVEQIDPANVAFGRPKSAIVPGKHPNTLQVKHGKKYMS
jgi:hypothetical protein